MTQPPSDAPDRDAEPRHIDTGSVPSTPLPALDEEHERLERKRLDGEQRYEQLQDAIDAEDDADGRQRRQNVRVHVQLPLTVRMSGREAKARTRDVSATGIGFSTRLPIEINQRGEVIIEFDGWHFCKGCIVRFAKPIIAGCQVGVQFEELSEEERERLVKQVFDVQRAQLQQKQSGGR